MMVTIRYAQNVYQVQISKAKSGLYWHWVKQRINWAKIIWIGKFQESTKNNTRNAKKKKKIKEKHYPIRLFFLLNYRSLP